MSASELIQHSEAQLRYARAKSAILPIGYVSQRSQLSGAPVGQIAPEQSADMDMTDDQLQMLIARTARQAVQEYIHVQGVAQPRRTPEKRLADVASLDQVIVAMVEDLSRPEVATPEDAREIMDEWRAAAPSYGHIRLPQKMMSDIGLMSNMTVEQRTMKMQTEMMSEMKKAVVEMSKATTAAKRAQQKQPRKKQGGPVLPVASSNQ